MKSAQNVSLSEITYDPSLQMRASNNEATVETYAELLRESNDWPFATPVIIFDISGTLVLADGWHRVEAAKRANLDCVRAHVRTGSHADAFRFALSANGDHGLNRSNADKHKAVESALMNKDYDDMSNRELAKACAVSEAFVRKVKQERRAKLERLESEVQRGLIAVMKVALELGETAWRTGDFDQCRDDFFESNGFGTGQALNEQWELILEMSNPELAETKRKSALEKYYQICFELLLLSMDRLTPTICEHRDRIIC